jgi:malate dehydrogenase (oxaloacetate-decarboxylating)
VGTNNEELIKDPLYLGLRKNRLRGEEYYDFIDKFVQAVRRNFPLAVLQWEDFSKQNAFTLLEKYRETVPSFNDDIQGTGAVALAGIKGALRITGSEIKDQTFAVLGAGAGGIGVARQIRQSLMANGLAPEEARDRVYVLDSRGVVYEGRRALDEYKREFSRKADFSDGWSLDSSGQVGLLDLVKNAGVTVLIGLSGKGGSFTEDVVKTMAKNTPGPVIFPLSNPTANAEAAPEDIYRWTGGKAVVATGSPFPEVILDGRTFTAGQGNNVFIFPGVGLGALAIEASVVTDEMITAAARRLSEIVPRDNLDINCVYPHPSELRKVCREVAMAVAEMAMEQGVARKTFAPEKLYDHISNRMWVPKYAKYTRGPEDA